MNKLCLNLNKNEKYVVACSFGPDSMALLHLAIQNGYDIVVAHVNYRKREAANYEQKQLEKYCADRGIKVYVLDLLGVNHKGNFQEWAREQRYKFFKSVAEKEHANAVLVAHQEDDVIETYLMQKKRGNFTKFSGIPRENELFGISVIRPLLAFSKQELMEFDDQNKIPYSIDESNLREEYDRNKIRHQIVEKMSPEERKKVLDEIKNQKFIEVEFKSIWGKEEFLNLSYEQVVKLMDYFMNKTLTHADISRKYVEEIKKAFRGKSTNIFNITNELRLEHDYENIYFVNKAKLQKYEFKFKTSFKSEFFDIEFKGGAEDRNIPSTEESLIIKNIEKNTRVIIKDYSSTINRLYIDWKMPLFLREVWPGIYNEKGELLYVPRYRKNFVDNHKSKFIFRTEYFTEF